MVVSLFVGLISIWMANLKALNHFLTFLKICFQQPRNLEINYSKTDFTDKPINKCLRISSFILRMKTAGGVGSSGRGSCEGQERTHSGLIAGDTVCLSNLKANTSSRRFQTPKHTGMPTNLLKNAKTASDKELCVIP